MRTASWARRPVVVLLALAASGAGLLVASRPIASAAPARDVLGATARLVATGGTLAPAYPAVLSACAAAALALAFAGPRLRPVVATLLFLGGAAAEVAWRTGLAGAAQALQRGSGVSGSRLQDVQVAAGWSVAGDAAALAVAFAGALAMVFGRRWQETSRRYDAAGGPPATPRPGATGRDRPADDWDAISRGEDPTL